MKLLVSRKNFRLIESQLERKNTRKTQKNQAKLFETKKLIIFKNSSYELFLVDIENLNARGKLWFLCQVLLQRVQVLYSI